MANHGSGSHHVAETLDRSGIERVFALTGGHVSPILEACASRGIDVVTTRDERSAAFMALADGVVERRAGVCVVTAGPGHTNAITGFTQAQEANYPLVSISGACELAAEDRGGLQDIDQVGMVEDESKWARLARRPERLPERVGEAIRQATAPRPGHAHLSIPVDVSNASTAAERAPTTPDSATAPKRPPDEAAVDEAIDALMAADRPVLLVGSGAWFADAGESLRRAVEKLQVPVFTHEAARGLVPDSHELCFGGLVFRLNGAARQVGEADCVVAVDIDPDWMLDYGEPPFFPEPTEATFVHVDWTGERLGQRLPVDTSIVADPASALRSLADRAGSDVERPTDWLDHLEAANREYEADVADDLTSDETPINPGRLSAELADAVDPETRVVFDGGSIGKWGKLAIPAERPGRWLRLKGPFAGIGAGLPTALAVQLRAPDDDVVLLTGDGSFGYHLMELETAVENDLPVVTVVANNAAWGSVGAEDVPEDTVLPATPFHELAATLGCEGELVTDPGEVGAALERALEADVPYLLNVHTANVHPPAAYPKTLQGY